MREVIPWQAVTPPETVNGGLEPILATVNSLHGAWERAIANASKREFDAARERNLRRHAIETGIIERLYDVSWGVTRALVADGLTLEVAEREGGLNPAALQVIKSQFDALEFLVRVVDRGRPLSASVVKELHAAITRHQPTYSALDSQGNLVERRLTHGDWKKLPNHVELQDGRLLEYTPPEHVSSEMDRLVEIYVELGGLHPLVRAAWLHHRFIRIHPFEDGNGRVGRALVLLTLLSAKYAPLVVERSQREAYLSALNRANTGDLLPLIRLFSESEIVALRSELVRPVDVPLESGAVSVAKAYAERYTELKVTHDRETKQLGAALATELHEQIFLHLDRVAEELENVFTPLDRSARVAVTSAKPPSDEARYWRYQIIRTARQVNFYTNLTEGTWWVRLHLSALSQTLRFVVAVQRVGYEDNGVLAVTVFAELLPPLDATEGDTPSLPEPVLECTSADSVTLVAGETVEARWQEVVDLMDRTLAAAVDSFGRALA
jgi:Fic family protein